jgi:hypothetical protein
VSCAPPLMPDDGGFDPLGGWHTSVVTEDDYFEIGGRIYETSLLPLQIRAQLSKSSLLFLGYSLRDMHVRHLITTSRGWAEGRVHHMVTKSVSRLDRWRFTRLRVRLYEVSIDAFVKALESERSDVRDSQLLVRADAHKAARRSTRR